MSALTQSNIIPFACDLKTCNRSHTPTWFEVKCPANSYNSVLWLSYYETLDSTDHQCKQYIHDFCIVFSQFQASVTSRDCLFKRHSMFEWCQTVVPEGQRILIFYMEVGLFRCILFTKGSLHFYIGRSTILNECILDFLEINLFVGNRTSVSDCNG